MNTIDVSISELNYNKKPQGDTIRMMTFKKETLSVDELATLISEGYSFCSIFNKEEFGTTDKTNANYQYTQVIAVDIDHSPLTFEEALKKVKTIPTIAYETFSNSLDNNSYRFLYIFDERIEGKELTKKYIIGVNSKIEEELSIKIDANAMKVSQYFNGNNNQKVITNNVTYSKNDFKIECNDIKVSTKTNKRTNNIIHLDDTFGNVSNFINDFWSISYIKLLDKYANAFNDIQHTDLPSVDDDTPIINIPNGFREIRRYWYIAESDDGTRRDCLRKLKDGDNRRKTLFLNGMIRRLIWNDISMENLIYNLVFEFIHYMINDGNKITKKEIFGIAQRIMKADLNDYDNLGKTTRKYMVNPMYCMKYNLSKRAVLNKLRSKIDYNEVASLYDCSISDKENIEVMKEFGINISIISLKRWRKKNNITKYKK